MKTRRGKKAPVAIKGLIDNNADLRSVIGVRDLAAYVAKLFGYC